MSEHTNEHDNATRAIHAGFHGDETGGVIPPIHQASTYAFRDAAHGAALFANQAEGYIYTRMGNPTIRVLEDNIAALEGGARGMACASGMGATNTLFFMLLGAGSHVVITDAVYGPSRLVLEKHWSRFGVEASFVDTSDLATVRAAMRQNTKLVFVETPANPTLKVSDLRQCAEIAHEQGALLAVDNTFMSPILQRPIEHGADIVMHSLTKFINGHSDVVGGMLVFRDEELYKRLRSSWFTFGATMDPHQAWLVIRGVKTLDMRVRRAMENAQQIAPWLETHPAVEWVSYPGLDSHAGKALHESQADGPGSLISFELKDGLAAGTNLMNSVKLMTLAVSLGGIETLIQHPASMTHAGLSEPQRQAAGITPGLVRLSVGCEAVADLKADLGQALD